MIIDESAFANPGLISTVIGPLAGNEHFCNFNISSPGLDTTNMQTRFESAAFPDGTKVYTTIAIRTMCVQCVKDGKKECPHVFEERPLWRTSRGIEVQRAILGTEQFQRETAGAAVVSSKQVFDPVHVAPLFDDPARTVSHTLEFPVVFVSIDPSGGGTQSDTGLCSLLFDRDDHVLVSGRIPRSRRYFASRRRSMR